MARKKTSINRVIFSLILALLAFSTIFMISYYVSYSEYQRISKEQISVLYTILNFDIKNSLLAHSCQNIASENLASEMDHMGSIINLLEQRFGKQDSRVLEQKKLYSSLEAEHFIYVRDYNLECAKNISTILFFYSNEETYSNSADRIGYILSSLKNKKGDVVMIYSFDYDIDAEAVNLLKNKYSVDKPNTIVVNEREKISDLKSIDEIEKRV